MTIHEQIVKSGTGQYAMSPTVVGVDTCRHRGKGHQPWPESHCEGATHSRCHAALAPGALIRYTRLSLEVVLDAPPSSTQATSTPLPHSLPSSYLRATSTPLPHSLPSSYLRALGVYVPVYLVPALLLHRQRLLHSAPALLPKLALGIARSRCAWLQMTLHGTGLGEHGSRCARIQMALLGTGLGVHGMAHSM